MTVRLVFLTDTHLGAQPGLGYVQQPRHTAHLPELLAALDAWIASQAREIAFVLHGGDMVDAASTEAISAARQAFSLRVPVYLSLGNHDLTAPDALELWLTQAPDFFPEHDPAYAISGKGWMVHVVPTQWCDTPYRWEDSQVPHVLPEHLAALRARLRAFPERAHLLFTHAAVLAVPGEQVGRSAPYHAPLASFSATVRSLVETFPQLRGVLGGHNHINTHGRLGPARAITASAFTETPFEFKVIELGAETLTMETVTLLPKVAFRADYDWERTFVQGRRCDRAF